MLYTLLMPILAQPQIIDVSDFGVHPNTRQDATQAVARALEAAKGRKVVVSFPAGEYHFWRENGAERDLFLSNSDVANPRRVAIWIEGQRNLTLQGKGVRLVFHDRIIPFVIEKSENVKLSGFEVDWERPLMSQARVQGADADGITLQISDEFPYAIEQGKLWFTDKAWRRQVWSFMEFDPSTKGVAAGTGDAGCLGGGWQNYVATELSPGHVRLKYKFSRLPKVGNVLVARHGLRDHCGTFIENSKNISLQDMNYRHTSGLGVLAQYSENLAYRNVNVMPDPIGQRLFAGHDDGFHFSNCKGSIVVDGCRFEGLMDDPINVHGTCVRIVEKLDKRTVRCRFMHDQSKGFRFGNQGDEISFIEHETMASLGIGKVVELKPISVEEFTVTFATDLPEQLKTTDALENLTWTPSLEVRNSVFGPVRARGLLVSTPKKVRIENCVFRSSGSAILIAGDANYWFESGAVRDVLIQNNLFENCLTSPYQFCDAVISVHPEIPKAGLPFHRNIRIQNNRFVTFDRPVLWAKSVDGLEFSGNEIATSRAIAPWHPNPNGLTIIDCQRVNVFGNRRADDYKGTSVQIEGGKPETIKIVGWTDSP